MSTPRCARTTSAASSRTTCTWRGSLPCCAAELERALGRRDAVEGDARAPSALETTLCATTSTSPSRERAVARAARRGRRRGAPRAGRGAPAPAAPAHRGRGAPAARACARRRRCARRARRAAPRGPRRCRRRARASGGSATRSARRRPAARLLVALAAARAERGRDRVGRRQQQRVGAVPWRSGTITTSGRARARRRAARRARPGPAPGSRRGRAARARLARERPVDAERARRRWPRSSSCDRLGAVGRGPAPRRRLAGDDDHLVDAPTRRSARARRLTIASASARAGAGRRASCPGAAWRRRSA